MILQKKVRGEAIYVKTCISAPQIHMKSIANDTVWVEIMIEKNNNFLLGGVYRSPNNTVENNAMLWTTLKMVNTYRYVKDTKINY